MGRRYLVVSDIHLADIEDHPDGWKYYKSSRYRVDGPFIEVLQEFMRAGKKGDQRILVLNGDIFDFDLVTSVPKNPAFAVSRFEQRRGLDATEEKSAWKLARILEHHGPLIDVFADFIADGGQLVYVMGNHDREFYFERVQEVLVHALEVSAKSRKRSLIKGSLRFEPWFYYVPGELYAEHGHQYDFYSSFRYLLTPVVETEAGAVIALPMANLTNRYLMSKMGFFNPHASDYILNLFRYLTHWARHYAFSRRSLILSWFFGSLLVVAKLLGLKRKLRVPPPDHASKLDEVARQYDLSTHDLIALAQLQPPPITSRLYRMIRELWIDRAVIALAMTAGTVALALSSAPLWTKLMVPLSSFPLAYVIYEFLAEGETVFTVVRELPERAREIAQRLPARVVALGHTHQPRLVPLNRTTTFVDTGTWAPVMDRKHRDGLAPGLRNYLLLEVDKEHTSVDFRSFC